MRAGLYLCVHCYLSSSRNRAWHRVTLKEYLLMTRMSKAWKVATPKGSLIYLHWAILPLAAALWPACYSLLISDSLLGSILSVPYYLVLWLLLWSLSVSCTGNPSHSCDSIYFELMAMKRVSSALNFARIDFLHLPLTLGQLTEAQKFSVGKQIRICLIRSLT